MERTKSSLHSALIALAREKPYPSIAVKEILDRANVGRSTFYTHFRDKDDLLESGIHELLRTLPDPLPSPAGAVGRLVDFSLPLLEHIDRHRHADGPKMMREGRASMHEHMRQVLAERIADWLSTSGPGISTGLPRDLVAHYVASTFVLVLNWWVENAEGLTPREVDARFRALVVPALAGIVRHSG